MSLTADARTDLVRACLREPVSRTPCGSCARRGAHCPNTGRPGATGSILPPSATPPCRPSSPCSRSGATASTPPSCSPTSSCRCTPSASGSTSSRPGPGGRRAVPQRGRPGAPPAVRAGDRRPLRGRDGRPGAPELDGIGRRADRVRRRALHRGQLRRRRRALPDLRQGQGPDAREPRPLGAADQRLAAMAVASLRAQIEAGAQAVQLFDSWAGSLSPDEYARFALPSTSPCWPGSPTSASRPSSSASAPASSSALMGSAGSDVVGVDWRVPLDEARRRVGRRPCAAGQPRPRALPGAVAGRRPRPPTVLAARRGWQRHRPRLQPGPRRAARDRTRASWPPSSSWSTRRPPGHDDRRPAHGARHAGEHGGDRPLLHAHPARPPAHPGAAGRARRALRAPSAACRPGRPHRRTGRCRPCRPRGARTGRYVVSFGASTPSR